MDIRKAISLLISAVVLANTVACGTILYPDRRGQTGGRIDAGVAVLDGIGLLFFILPGVIAFAVDFGNGSIYLPGGGRHLSSGDLNTNSLKIVKIPKDMDAHALEQIIARQTRIKIHLDDPNLIVQKNLALSDVEHRVALMAQENLQTASALQ